ncbi:ABC transporter permease [Tropheryma whipplei]|uniref:ABC transporter permease n=1 Tax=Tropheryma whipplei TaxID=2039 RepID=UPI0004B17393|nr:ABC transporter permease [Tropheryma whipplei]
MQKYSVGPFRQALTHARYKFTEQIRTPFSIILGLGMPVASFIFFVLPQEGYVSNPKIATYAVVSFSVFGMMTNSLIGFARDIAMDRLTEWGAYMNSLPGYAISRVIGYIFSNGAISVLSIIPVLIVGFAATQIEIDSVRYLPAFLTLIATNTIFMLLGTAIGFAFSAASAIAVSQFLMLLLSFSGGLFVPPTNFPAWFNLISLFVPTRAVRELNIWASVGGPFPVTQGFMWLVWLVLFTAAAIFAAKWRQSHTSFGVYH